MSMPLPRIDQVGWYGKLPAFGDFASRRLPQEFIGDFDAWLARSILASREMLGEGWTQTYLDSPIWRFLLPPGALGAGYSETWAGVMMASVDRVGRHFPFIIAAPFTQGSDPSNNLPVMSRWWAGLEDAALEALQHDLDGDAVDAELAAQLSGAERGHRAPSSVHSLMDDLAVPDLYTSDAYRSKSHAPDPLALDSFEPGPVEADPLSLDMFVPGSVSSAAGGLLDDLDFSSSDLLLPPDFPETAPEPVAAPESAAPVAIPEPEADFQIKTGRHEAIQTIQSAPLPFAESDASLPGLLSQNLNLATSGHSLWSVAPRHGAEPIVAMHCVAGMPDVFQFVAMLRTRPVRRAQS